MISKPNGIFLTQPNSSQTESEFKKKQTETEPKFKYLLCTSLDTNFPFLKTSL